MILDPKMTTLGACQEVWYRDGGDHDPDHGISQYPLCRGFGPTGGDTDITDR